MSIYNELIDRYKDIYPPTKDNSTYIINPSIFELMIRRVQSNKYTDREILEYYADKDQVYADLAMMELGRI